MPASATTLPDSTVRDEEPYTFEEIEFAFELSSRDPDVELPPRLKGALLKAAVHGASIGLLHASNTPMGHGSSLPESALEVGSRWA